LFLTKILVVVPFRLNACRSSNPRPWNDLKWAFSCTTSVEPTEHFRPRIAADGESFPFLLVPAEVG
jgi:hypothetical protein